jgi:hypothetical protein
MTIYVGAAFAQSANYFPDFLSAYFYNMASVNPGYIPTEGKADFAAGYKFRTGAFKDISTLSFSAAKYFRNESGSAHAARISGGNEQEGPYINSPKAYLNYAYSLPLAEHTHLFAGLAFGTAGIYFSAPSATTSLLLPDGSIGLGLHHRGISLGASSYQIFNNQVSPLLATIRFARYYQLYLNAEKELGIDWKLRSYFLWRILPKTRNEASLALSLTYLDVLVFGTAFKNDVGLSFFGSCYIDTEKDRLLLSFAYNSAFISTYPGLQNSMEISLGFLVR